MSNYICIDGGTSNTRINLAVNNKVLDTVKGNIGVGNNTPENIKEFLKLGINTVLTRNNLNQSDITCVLASGMITSERGICCLKHINAPAGIEELHNAMQQKLFKDICNIPFYFVCGVKVNCNNFETADMMRGEETELIGLTEQPEKESIYILPGSHSKIIKTDITGRISDFSTMFTGEMLVALSNNTVLKNLIDIKNSNLNIEFLLKGYNYCKQYGINNALFKTRVLNTLFEKSKDECYSFFMGTVLQSEIEEILKINSKKIIIGGRQQLKQAMYEILSRVSESEVILVPEHTVNYSTTKGLIKIFEYKK